MKIEEMASKVIVRKLKAIVRMERKADRDSLLYLYELDRRGDIARDSYGTIVDYCVELLGMGEKAARCRAKVVGMMKRWPRIVDDVRAGWVNMSTLLKVDDVIDDDNVGRVLEEIAGMSEQDVDLYMMVNFDQATRKVSLQVDQELQHDLEDLTDLAAHAVGTKLVDVLRYGVKLAIAELARRKAGGETAVRRENAPPFATLRRYIPVAVRREVFRRDGGCCAYVGPDGRRCCSMRRLEFHHVRAYAHGGPPTVDNIKVYCRVHNTLAAMDDFGAEHMAKKRRRTAAPAATDVAEQAGTA